MIAQIPAASLPRQSVEQLNWDRFGKTQMNTKFYTALFLVLSALVVPSQAQSVGFRLPPNAQLIEEDAYYLGRGKDKNGEDIEGIAFLHPRKHNAKGGKPGGGGGTTTCYSLMSSGAKWKAVEGFIVDPATSSPITPASVANNIESALSQWENAIVPPTAIFGTGSTAAIGAAARAAIGSSANGLNEFVFDSIQQNGVIAVTIVWGRFSGPTFARQLVEWDMIFDDEDFEFVDFVTGVTPITPNTMDFLNIFQHEAGHALGLSHPSSTCNDETMFASAAAGETKKRSLESGDIAGINALYP
jgi:hypothetical protein